MKPTPQEILKQHLEHVCFYAAEREALAHAIAALDEVEALRAQLHFLKQKVRDFEKIAAWAMTDAAKETHATLMQALAETDDDPR